MRPAPDRRLVAGRPHLLASVSWLAITLLAACRPAQAQTLDEARALHLEGRYEEALEAYGRIARSSQETDPAAAATAHNNACVLLTDLGRHEAAVTECRLALDLRRRIGDDLTLARTLNNLGRALQHVGDPVEAETSLHEALAINERLGEVRAQVVNLTNLGVVATQAGRFSRALEFHSRAAELAAGHPEEPWAAQRLQIAKINLGVVLEKLGAYRRALRTYQEVLAAPEALTARQRAALLSNIGVVYRNLGDPVSAIAEFQRALELYRREGDRAGRSNALLNIALARHLNLRELDAAEAAYRDALRLAEEAGDDAERIQDLFYLGRLVLERNRSDEAEALLRRCLAAARESDSAEGRWSAMEGLGRVYRSRGELSRALEYLRQAMAEVERVRGSLPDARLRSEFFGDQRSVYVSAVEVLGELERQAPGKGYGERALEVVQRAKARDLLDALGPASRPAAPLRAASLRRQAGDGAVLEYFVGEQSLYLWVIRRLSIRMLDLGPPGPNLRHVAKLHHGLSRGADPDPEVLASLSAALLPAAAGDLSDLSSLVIAPDGLLHYLPFDLLAISDRPATPIVDRAALRYLPSASTLHRPDPSARQPELRLLGLADPRLQPADVPRSAILEDLQAHFQLPPLPASARELQMIGRRLGGRQEIYLADRATEAAFRRAAARGARIVHLGTHTVLDERPGRGAAIVLGAGGSDDGLLRPEEIARLRLGAWLTVLAGCRTALGSEVDGRALNSLTGSFLAAGSRAVLATLWDVSDAGTAAFMSQFYFQLRQGMPSAEALRRTKHRFRTDPDWGHPALWAAYILVGQDSRPLPQDQGFRMLTAPAVATALLIVLLLLEVGRRARKSRPSSSRSTRS